MILALYGITVLYVIFIISLVYGFCKLPIFKGEESHPKIGFSIVIPFRNEANKLPQLLGSIKDLSYAKDQFEVLLVDDKSEDLSVEIIKSTLNGFDINYQILPNRRSSGSPKKDAIKTAIQQSRFDWILTTDADCILPSKWLLTFARFIQKQNSEMVVGPISYMAIDFSFLEQFQTLDFLSLQGSTAGGFGIGQAFLCNGANLAYKKAIFRALNGFDGNDQIASGDDIFLLEKFLKKHKEKVHFLKSKWAIVRTYPLKSWQEVIQQRTRWAAKSSSYSLGIARFAGLLVLMMNLGWIAGIGMMLWKSKFVFFVIITALKLVADFFFIKLTSAFYKSKTQTLRTFPLSFFIYPFFSSYIALRSVFASYRWKGRKFKR